MVKRHTAIIT